MPLDAPLSIKAARELLGVGPLAGAGEIRRAFREAAKRAHPDRPEGDEQRFRRVVAAYHRLQPPPHRGERIVQPPAPRAPEPAILTLDPLVCLRGGSVEHTLADGRRIRVRLPPGLRTGDVVRAGEARLTIVLRGSPDMLVRGDDLWASVDVPPRVLADGGRVALETPVGRRIVWLSKKAGERGLVRLVGQGLPARGQHPQGHLFLRLSPATGEAHSAARTLLRRFTAAWAA
ncbi:MAG: DnaJ domain-containing protein [Phenylobacterium sp.]